MSDAWGKNRRPLPGNSHAITRGPLAGRRGRPPRAAKAQARADKAAVAGAVASVDRAIAAAERCRQAEAQQEDADSTRQLAEPRQRGPTHQLTLAAEQKAPRPPDRSAPASKLGRVDSHPELGRNSFYTGAIREVGSRRES